MSKVALLSAAAVLAIPVAMETHDWVGLLVILLVFLVCERILLVRRRTETRNKVRR